MKFESPNTPSSQEDFTQFYSSDPYEVLGISRDASDDDIKIAKRNLQGKFHPDVNKDQKAVEISQNINVAYDTIRNERKNSDGASPLNSSRYSKQSRRRSNTYATDNPKERKEETPAEKIENRLISSLSIWPDEPKKFISDAKKEGVSSERTIELIKSGEAQKNIKEGFMSKLKIWGGDGSDQFIKFVEQWKEVGVELDYYFNLPEVRNLLIDIAINVKIKIWGSESSNYFKKFTESWKKAGVDLEELVNSPRAQQVLTDIASFKLSFREHDDFKPFVKSWIEVGWKPNQEILTLYNN